MLEVQPDSADDLYLLYLELTTSGLELDHGCVRAGCINPDCLELVTGSVNNQRRVSRKRVALSFSTC